MRAHTHTHTHTPISQKVRVVCEELCGIFAAVAGFKAGLINEVSVLIPVRSDGEDDG